MRNFRELNIWKDSLLLAREIYKLTKGLPTEEKFGLVSQINRAAVSIPSNTAEGCSRSSDKDFKRFLELALGSAYELETQLILMNDVYANLNGQDQIPRLNSLQKSINAFIQSLKTRLSNPKTQPLKP